MVVKSIHFVIAIYLMVLLDVVHQDEFYVVNVLRFPPKVFPINTPEKQISQMLRNHTGKK